MKKLHFKNPWFALLIFVALFFSQFSYSQLTSFTLQVTVTDETCTGNGSLNFTTTGTTTGATILYSIYLIPDVINPIVTTQNTTVTGLNSGSYKVVALQSLGNLSNTQEQIVQIQNQVSPLEYHLIGVPQNCTTGSISVSVTQGVPLTYEIISGPILFPPQSSNVFNGLIAGLYDIRVNDFCGNGSVQSFTLLNIIGGNLTLTPLINTCNVIDCNTNAVFFNVNAIQNTVIQYPLNVELTVFPPNGSPPIIVNQTVTTGMPTIETISLNSQYYSTSFLSSVKVTDGCNNIYTLQTTIDGNGGFGLNPQGLRDCYKKIFFDPCRVVFPYTVTFLSTPPGFNPTIFNNNHPGPFFGDIVYQSNDQNEMPSGIYEIQIVDACGRSYQNQINVRQSETDYLVTVIEDVCSQNSILYVPNSGVLISTAIITSAPDDFMFPLPYDASSLIDPETHLLQIELIPGFYAFTGTNVCGDVYYFEEEILPTHIPLLEVTGGNEIGCRQFSGVISVSQTGGPFLTSVIITQAPASYNVALPNDVSNLISCTFIGGDVQEYECEFGIQGLSVGDYTLVITDNCGNVSTRIVNVPLLISQEPLQDVRFRRGCEIGYGSLTFASPNRNLTSVIISSAPSSFMFSLPYNVSFNIAFNGSFYMNSLPEGDYVFETIDGCGVVKTTPIFVPGLLNTISNFDVQKNCGSFNIVFHHQDNNPYTPEYWLQRYNPVLNRWEHPLTGIPYTNGAQVTENNAMELINISATANINIAATGDFRILKVFIIFQNGNPLGIACINDIYDFNFTDTLSIDSAFSLPCSTNGNEVVLNVSGVAPFQYKITTKNGLPFLVNNGTNNVFTGLLPGVYNFQVIDLCGNIVNRLFDVSSLPEPTITQNGLCNGQNGQLLVQPFSYLSYQWWKSTNPSTILSTTNVLNFTPFSSVTSPGTYFVRIYSATNLSCIDKTISYVVPTVISPNAGQNSNATLCGNGVTYNLFTLLMGNYDSNGTWEEISNSGMLSGSSWLTIGVPFGVYQFKYKVFGFCDDVAEALVTINLNEIPSTPTIDVLPTVCEGNSLELHTDLIPNVSYTWSGPNGFTSNEQNPIIDQVVSSNSGVYTVKVIKNGCESPIASVEVIVNKNPEFAFEDSCVSNSYTITAVPTYNSFNSNDVSYSWTGPDNYASTENPITITGKKTGEYFLTITNLEGCSVTKSINVLNTLCVIQQGVSVNDDGDNDTFDLTGFDVDNLKIFNRYGMIVFEQNNYIDQWHGQDYNNNELPSATYFYQVLLLTGETKTGWVYLIRD